MAGIKLSNIRTTSIRHAGVKLAIENREKSYDELVAMLDDQIEKGGGRRWYNWIAEKCVMEDGSPILPIVATPRKRKAAEEAVVETEAAPAVPATGEELDKLQDVLNAAAKAAPEERSTV